MPAQKDLKRLVRRRMQKTGEAYATARAHLLNQRPSRPAASAAPVRLPVTVEPPAAQVPASSDYAGLAGMSDAAIKAKTGCNWERWVWALDKSKAYEWPHRKISEFVSKTYKVPDWWCQTVVVGYERIKGLRAIGQRRDGSYEATKSRTIPASISSLFRAWHDPKVRRRWLPSGDLEVRTATRNKSIRFTSADRSSVEVRFTAKGRGKAQVAIQHRKLPDRAASLRMKEYWSERLEWLAAALEKGGPA